MSYLTTPDLPGFSKCVISFWFRVAQKDLDAVQKEYDDWWDAHGHDDPDGEGPQEPPLLGKVPLLVFGKRGTSARHPKEHNDFTPHTEVRSLHSCATVNATYDNSWPTACVSWDNECSDSSQEEIWSSVTVSYSTTGGKPIEPSYIAIDAGGFLRINFESAKVGNYTGTCGLLSAEGGHFPSGHTDLCCYYPITNECGSGTECISDPFPGTLPGIMVWVFGLIALHLLTAVASTCEISSSGATDYVEGVSSVGAIPGDMGSGAIQWQGGSVGGDQWHHVLISVDMSKGSAATAGNIGASSTLYVAIDDVNIKTGRYPLEDTNEVMTAGAGAAYGAQERKDCPPASYSQPDMSVPSAPVGIPATAEYVDKIRQVEMAELLFFIDQVLDTSKEENRRHFITGKGTDGFQRPTNTWPLFIPMRKFSIGDPFYWEDGADDPAFAPPLFDPSAWPTGIKGLGNADIDFTKCSWNWQMGRNIGKLSGKVAKTGQIKEYDPKDPPQIQAAG